jgi:predicted enzyme related to lactoylglutathione lyase
MPTKTQTKNEPEKMNGKRSGNPLVWAEIPVTDMERAKTFYGKTFDFTFHMHDSGDYKLAMFPSAGEKSYGAGGALMFGPSYTPSYHGTVVYFSTPDIEATLKKVVQNGATVVQNKKSIGEYGFIGFFEDSEGNRIGLHSMK